jgi:heterodisulfide reductase subunit D
VLHHTQFINALLKEGRIKVEGGAFSGKRIIFHDPCYLGRGNGEYEAPREVLLKSDAALVEMKRSKARTACVAGRVVLRCSRKRNPARAT